MDERQRSKDTSHTHQPVADYGFYKDPESNEISNQGNKWDNWGNTLT